MACTWKLSKYIGATINIWYTYCFHNIIGEWFHTHTYISICLYNLRKHFMVAMIPHGIILLFFSNTPRFKNLSTTWCVFSRLFNRTSSTYHHGKQNHCYTPAPPKVERGYTGFTLMSVRPSVCPSVRPSVGKVSATFRENYWLNSFHPWDLYLWGKSLDPYRFSCWCPHFWPSGGQKLTENRGFRNFSRKLSARFISSLGFILMG